MKYLDQVLKYFAIKYKYYQVLLLDRGVKYKYSIKYSFFVLDTKYSSTSTVLDTTLEATGVAEELHMSLLSRIK